MNFCILGSNPSLSQAELFSVLSDIKNVEQTDKMLSFNCRSWNGQSLMNQLGGTVKLGNIIHTCPIDKLDANLIANLIAPASLKENAGRSLDFGLTVYGSQKFQRLPIQLKKELKARGYSVRWVTGKNSEPLSPAAVAKCKLTQASNADLCLSIANNTVFIGKTTHVQDADAWSKRDYDRPKRDSKNGMLPPKLARIMVNLAQTPDNGLLLDPFCGSGTILMEAALATSAKQIIGSDIESKQISYTDKNNDWLLREKIISGTDHKRFRTFTTDVRKLKKFIPSESIDTIVTEGYLGPLLQGNESPKQLKTNAEEVQNLWIDSLKALKPLLKNTATLIIITPTYKTKRGTASVDLTANLNELGYKKSKFVVPTRHASKALQAQRNSKFELSYGRENQFIKRNINILKPI